MMGYRWPSQPMMKAKPMMISSNNRTIQMFLAEAAIKAPLY